jgi:Glycosyl transferase family 2
MLSSFAVVIEWENARFAAMERTRAMLRTLRAQLDEVTSSRRISAEVIIVYNQRDIDRAMIDEEVKSCFRPADAPAAVRIFATDGLRYYQQKNFGAAQSEADIVVLLDCDIIPERGWLASMLEAFNRADVNVVAGETYVALSGWYSRAFALFWFFPLRDPSTQLEIGSFFHANNVAFRRAVFRRFGFPELDAYRAQCSVLGKTLKQAGFPIYVQKKARASHPTPRGIWYFIARALHTGRDLAIFNDIYWGKTEGHPAKVAYWHFRNDLPIVLNRVWERRKDVGLGFAGSLFAVLVATTYFSLRAIGEFVGRWKPDLLPRYFPI